MANPDSVATIRLAVAVANTGFARLLAILGQGCGWRIRSKAVGVCSEAERDVTYVVICFARLYAFHAA